MSHVAHLVDVDLAAADPNGMLDAVRDSAGQWRRASAIALEGPSPPVTEPAAVVVAGMGGSGIAGDVAALAAEVDGHVPVVPVKGYELPAWVDPRTLVIAVSHSGATEETLACVEQATATGAALFAVTSGGALSRRASDDGFPVVTVPGDLQPRASLAYLAVPVLVALERAGVIAGVTDQLPRVAEALDPLVAAWGDLDGGAGDAGSLATALLELVPVFHGGRGVGSLVATRARCQMNENAKRPAFSSELPELDHNEVVAWGTLAAAGDDGPAMVAMRDSAGRLGLVMLRDADEHPQVGRRFEVTAELSGAAFGALHSHTLAGDTWLTRLAAGVLFADFVSVHLALLSGVDPTPVAPIAELKRRISSSSSPSIAGGADTRRRLDPPSREDPRTGTGAGT